MQLNVAMVAFTGDGLSLLKGTVVCAMPVKGKVKPSVVMIPGMI